MTTQIKIGVIGAGHLGKIHIKCILAAKEALHLVGFYDDDAQVRQKVAQEWQIKAFDSVEALLEVVEAVDIVTPTTTHFEIAQKALLQLRHVFVEKPITATIEQAKILQQIAIENGLKVQVGHVERFNPAFLALKGQTLAPKFIEAHRLAQFNPRGTDVSVVLDLMIHDLDIVLHLVKSNIKSIHANGVAIVSPTADIVNARLEFENGCVANLTASRLSLKQMRKVRLFQPDAYISLDFLEKNAQIIRLSEVTEGGDEMPNFGNSFELETTSGKKRIDILMPESQPINAIQMELTTFAQAICNDTTPIVTLEDGLHALEVAQQIIDISSSYENKMLI